MPHSGDGVNHLSGSNAHVMRSNDCRGGRREVPVLSSPSHSPVGSFPGSDNILFKSDIGHPAFEIKALPRPRPFRSLEECEANDCDPIIDGT